MAVVSGLATATMASPTTTMTTTSYIPRDPAVASAAAAGRIPPEVSLAFLDETKDAPAIAAIIFLLVLTGIVVLGRLFSRVFVLKRFGYDDALALLSFVRTNTSSTCMHWEPVRLTLPPSCS